MGIMGAFKLLPQVLKASGDIQQKGWYASKTVWFNLLVLAIDVAVKVFGKDLPISGEAVDAIAGGLCAGGNIVLRCITDKPLGMKTKRDSQEG